MSQQSATYVVSGGNITHSGFNQVIDILQNPITGHRHDGVFGYGPLTNFSSASFTNVSTNTLNVSGASLLGGATQVSGPLTVGGTITGSSLAVVGNASVGGYLAVSGGISPGVYLAPGNMSTSNIVTSIVGGANILISGSQISGGGVVTVAVTGAPLAGTNTSFGTVVMGSATALNNFLVSGQTGTASFYVASGYNASFGGTVTIQSGLTAGQYLAPGNYSSSYIVTQLVAGTNVALTPSQGPGGGVVTINVGSISGGLTAGANASLNIVVFGSTTILSGTFTQSTQNATFIAGAVIASGFNLSVGGSVQIQSSMLANDAIIANNLSSPSIVIGSAAFTGFSSGNAVIGSGIVTSLLSAGSIYAQSASVVGNLSAGSIFVQSAQIIGNLSTETLYVTSATIVNLATATEVVGAGIMATNISALTLSVASAGGGGGIVDSIVQLGTLTSKFYGNINFSAGANFYISADTTTNTITLNASTAPAVGVNPGQNTSFGTMLLGPTTVGGTLGSSYLNVSGNTILNNVSMTGVMVESAGFQNIVTSTLTAVSATTQYITAAIGFVGGNISANAAQIKWLTVASAGGGGGIVTKLSAGGLALYGNVNLSMGNFIYYSTDPSTNTITINASTAPGVGVAPGANTSFGYLVQGSTLVRNTLQASGDTTLANVAIGSGYTLSAGGTVQLQSRLLANDGVFTLNVSAGSLVVAGSAMVTGNISTASIATGTAFVQGQLSAGVLNLASAGGGTGVVFSLSAVGGTSSFFGNILLSAGANFFFSADNTHNVITFNASTAAGTGVVAGANTSFGTVDLGNTSIGGTLNVSGNTIVGNISVTGAIVGTLNEQIVIGSSITMYSGTFQYLNAALGVTTVTLSTTNLNVQAWTGGTIVMQSGLTQTNVNTSAGNFRFFQMSGGQTLLTLNETNASAVPDVSGNPGWMITLNNNAGGTAASSDIAFQYVPSSGNINTNMIVTASGNVGIGTVNPNATLEVNGNVKVDGTVTAQTAALTQTASYVIESIAGTIYAIPAPDSGLNASSGTNAATVIQNAANALTSGGEVVIRAGIYAFTSGVVITKSNVRIRGEGIEATKIVPSNNVGAFRFDGTSASTFFGSISDLSISAASPQSIGYGVSWVGDCYQMSIQRVRTNNLYIAIVVNCYIPPSSPCRAESGWITDCIFWNTTSNVIELDNMTGVFIRGCNSYNSPQANQGIAWYNGGGLWISDCDFMQTGKGMTINATSPSTCKFLFMSNVSFDTLNSYGLLITGNGSMQYFQISNLHISTAGDHGVAIYNASQANNIYFVNPHVFNCQNSGFYMDSINNVFIEGGIINDNNQSNSITPSAQQGVYINSVTNLRISNVRIANGFTSPVGNQKYGIYDNGGCSNLIFTNNDLTGNATKGALISSQSVIKNNLGYNPLGQITSPYSAGAGTISDASKAQNYPSSTTNYTVTGSPKLITIYGGTVSDISIGGVSTKFTSGIFRLEPGQVLTVTWSVQPGSVVYAC